MRILRQCLLDTNLARLRAIARFWDVELMASRQRDAAMQLAQVMATPEAITYAWGTLPEDQRQALKQLLATDGQMPLRIFTREWGEIRSMGPGRLARERPWQTPISSAEGLWYTGFISRAFEQGEDDAYEVIFIPPEIRDHLPVPSASSPALTLEASPDPSVVHSSGDAFLDDVCTLLAYLQNERMRPGRDEGGWPARHADDLARRLRDPDPTRMSLLQHLTQRLGWLRVTDSNHLRPDPGPVTAWLQSPTDQQRSVLAVAWQEDSIWNDLFHVPTLHPEDTGAWRNDPLRARKSICQHLEICTPNIWYKIGDFVAAIKQIDPDFQRPGGDYDAWYIRDAATGAYLSGFESWEAIEGAFIRYLITGPLAWLGLTDLGAVTPNQPWTVFRLTAAGAVCLNLADQSLPQTEPTPLDLRPNFTLLVPPPRRYERFQLARVADWVNSPPAEEVKGFFIYRLAPNSLERARQQGISVTRVLEFLNQVTDAPVHRSVEAALTRWDARGIEARLERVMLLRLSDEDLMTQVKSSPLTRSFIQERIGPTAALVRECDWANLASALGEMGLFPDIVREENIGS
mgnify:CR=1 FL=1